jgi:hypothetical protein
MNSTIDEVLERLDALQADLRRHQVAGGLDTSRIQEWLEDLSTYTESAFSDQGDGYLSSTSIRSAASNLLSEKTRNVRFAPLSPKPPRTPKDNQHLKPQEDIEKLPQNTQGSHTTEHSSGEIIGDQKSIPSLLRTCLNKRSQLSESVVEDLDTQLLDASESGTVQEITDVIKRGAHPDGIDGIFTGDLSKFIQRYPAGRAIMSNRAVALSTLLQAGASFMSPFFKISHFLGNEKSPKQHYRDVLRFSWLAVASVFSVECLKILIEFGVDVNRGGHGIQEDARGIFETECPLLCLVVAIKANLGWLLSRLDAPKKLDYNAQLRSSIQSLLYHGADIDYNWQIRSVKRKCTTIISTFQLLLTSDKVLRDVGEIEYIRQMLRYGARVNPNSKQIKDKSNIRISGGHTYVTNIKDPLQNALFKGETEIIRLLCTRDISTDPTGYIFDIVGECAYHFKGECTNSTHLQWDTIRSMIVTLLRCGGSTSSRRRVSYFQKSRHLIWKSLRIVEDRLSVVELAANMHIRDDIDRKALLNLLKKR